METTKPKRKYTKRAVKQVEPVNENVITPIDKKEDIVRKVQNTHRSTKKYNNQPPSLSEVNVRLTMQVSELQKIIEGLQARNLELYSLVQIVEQSRLVRLAVKIVKYFQNENIPKTSAK